MKVVKNTNFQSQVELTLLYICKFLKEYILTAFITEKKNFAVYMR